ncbi:hypothetical protein [Francisella uliginis]|nr:hypothetical protein [Francisella uliginis]
MFFIIYSILSFGVLFLIIVFLFLCQHLITDKNNFIIFIQGSIYLLIVGVISYLLFPYINTYIKSGSVSFDFHRLIIGQYKSLLYLLILTVGLDLSYIFIGNYRDKELQKQKHMKLLGKEAYDFYKNL